MMSDFLERLVEDETWPHKYAPPLVTATEYQKKVGGRDITVPLRPGNILQIEPDQLSIKVTSEILKSRSGFGRFDGLATPHREGLTNPWRGNGRPIHSDAPDREMKTDE